MALILLRTACGQKLQPQRGSGATIVTVPGGNGAVTSREAAVEILVLNIFGIADRDGLLVTRRMVDKRLAELGGRPRHAST